MQTAYPSTEFPEFFRVRQKMHLPTLGSISSTTREQLLGTGLEKKIKPGDSVAITVGSRGIANILEITRSVVDTVKSLGGVPFVVPAMGSHGGATASGQTSVLERFGVTEASLGCPIRSSMETLVVCNAKEGFPVHFDKFASQANHVIVVNRIKPHTRFNGAIESGLMKMMLIGLGKHAGALVYHRAIMNFSFDQIVRSVAREVIARCKIAAGIAIIENAVEQTAQIVGIPADQIEQEEPTLLCQAKQLLPKLPFDHAELLIVDQIGKDISGAGMDTNVIGRKNYDHAALQNESPKIHHIYVRDLTPATHGNATGIGIAELCHQNVLDKIDRQATQVNCLTAGHVTAAMIPISFTSDHQAIQAAIGMAGLIPPNQVPIQWIHNTLQILEVECSQAFFQEANNREDLEILAPPRPLQFESSGNLVPRFPTHSTQPPRH